VRVSAHFVTRLSTCSSHCFVQRKSALLTRRFFSPSLQLPPLGSAGSPSSPFAFTPYSELIVSASRSHHISIPASQLLCRWQESRSRGVEGPVGRGPPARRERARLATRFLAHVILTAAIQRLADRICRPRGVMRTSHQSCQGRPHRGNWRVSAPLRTQSTGQRKCLTKHPVRALWVLSF